MSYLINLECSSCTKDYNADFIHTVCQDCGAPLLARYDLAKAREKIDRDEFIIRQGGMWRWHEILPVKDLNSLASFGEGDSPLLPIERVGAHLGLSHLNLKDESRNPTASFKARGLSTAVSKAKELGLKRLVIPTAGNAGGALATYASRAGLESAVVMPEDTPSAIIRECKLSGAEIILINGLISDCARIVSQMTATGEWFSVSTFREPYRLEGKKILGYELAEAFGWKLPDVIIYPTGGGTGLVGMWKAFLELLELGWLEEKKLPKMVSVQSTGCAPIVEAFNSGKDRSDFWNDAETIASGLRVPKSLADHMMLKILRESGGSAVAVSDESIQHSQKSLARLEGVYASPEGAAPLAAIDELIETNIIRSEDHIVLFNTASGVKYID
jgi:threonine synthase